MREGLELIEAADKLIDFWRQRSLKLEDALKTVLRLTHQGEIAAAQAVIEIALEVKNANLPSNTRKEKK